MKRFRYGVLLLVAAGALLLASFGGGLSLGASQPDQGAGSGTNAWFGEVQNTLGLHW